MSKLPENIKRVTASDCGDGSTSFTIEFADGTSWHANPDIPHDFGGEAPEDADYELGGVFIEWTPEHGERLMQERYLTEAPYTDLEPIPAVGY